ncbi:hypothetical protein pb186bvf_005166 [Paramecium bursaria]
MMLQNNRLNTLKKIKLQTIQGNKYNQNDQQNDWQNYQHDQHQNQKPDFKFLRIRFKKNCLKQGQNNIMFILLLIVKYIWEINQIKKNKQIFFIIFDRLASVNVIEDMINEGSIKQILQKENFYIIDFCLFYGINILVT